MKNVVAMALGLFFSIGAYADGSAQSAIETKDVPLVIGTPLDYRSVAPSAQALPPANSRFDNPDPLKYIDNGDSRTQNRFQMPWKDKVRTLKEMGFVRGNQGAARGPIQPGQIEKSPVEFVVRDNSDTTAIRKFVNLFENDLRSWWVGFTMSRDVERRAESRRELRSVIDVLNDFNPRSPHLIYANLYLHGILKSILASFDLNDSGGITIRFLDLLAGFHPKSEEAKSLIFEIAKAALRSEKEHAQSYALEMLSVVSNDQTATQGHRQTQVLAVLQKAIEGNKLLSSILQLKSYAILSTMNPASAHVAKLRQELLFKYLPQYGQDSDSAMALAGGDALVRSVDLKDPATQYYAELYIRGVLKNILVSLETRGADDLNYKWIKLVAGFNSKSEEIKSLMLDIAKAAYRLDDSRFQVSAIDLFRMLIEDPSASQGHRQLQILAVLQETLDSGKLDDFIAYKTYNVISTLNPATEQVTMIRQQLIFKYLAPAGPMDFRLGKIGEDAAKEATLARDASTQIRIIKNAQATLLANVQNPNEASYLGALQALYLVQPVSALVAIEKASALATIIRVAPEKLRSKTSALFHEKLPALEVSAHSGEFLNVFHFRIIDSLIGSEVEWQNQMAFSESVVVQGKVLTQLLALSSLQTDTIETFSRKIRIVSEALKSPNARVREVATGILRDEVLNVSRHAARGADQKLAVVAEVVAENLRNSESPFKDQKYLTALVKIFTYSDWFPHVRFRPESVAQVLREINKLAVNNPNLVQMVRLGLSDMIMSGDVSCDKLLRAVHPYQ